MMNKQPVKLVATDLDGTFLKSDNSVSAQNLEALHLLSEKGITRVIATGRNLQKTREVISTGVPFDYIVFSSGAGVFDCSGEKLVYHQNMEENLTHQLTEYLIRSDLNFYLFRPVPENFKCQYNRGSVPCQEFENYLRFHHQYSEPLSKDFKIYGESCQFLVVFPNQLSRFLKFKDEIEGYFEGVKVVRTSSPMETGYIWMEIFHESVSKGNGVKFICDLLNIGYEHTLGIGNDFNDIDLLEFTKYSYVVENSPDELKRKYLKTGSNNDNGFSKAIYNHL